MKIFGIDYLSKFNNKRLEEILDEVDESNREYLGKILCENDVFHLSCGESTSIETDYSGFETSIMCQFCHKTINISCKVEE